MARPSPEQIVAAHQKAVRAVRVKVEKYTRSVWAGKANFRDSDIDELVERIVPVVLGGQKQAASITDAYIAAIVGGKPVGVPNSIGSRGVDPDEVYRRPAATVYDQLSKGATFADAVAAGANRLQSLVGTDIQMAVRDQARESMVANNIVGYSRVLTGAENCALCEVAATQRYFAEELMPIHPGCDCGVAPIEGESDPGQVINAERLEEIHSSVEPFAGGYDRGGRSPDYRQIMVRDHGEYGPTLTWRTDKFTGPSDL